MVCIDFTLVSTSSTDGQRSGRARELSIATSIATSTPSSSESYDISFVLGVGTIVADSAGEGIAEAANVEVERAAFSLVDDGDEVHRLRRSRPGRCR